MTHCPLRSRRLFVGGLCLLTLLGLARVRGAQTALQADTPLAANDASESGRPTLVPPADSPPATPAPLTKDSLPASASTSPSSGTGLIQSSPPSAVKAFETQPLGQRRPKSADHNSVAQADKAAAESSAPSILRPMLALLAVLAAIMLLAYAFRRWVVKTPRHRHHPAIEILARSAIGPRQSLCLIKLGPQLVLVGISPNHLASLCTIEDPEDIAQIRGLVEKNAPHSVTNSFNKMFQQETRDYDPRETLTETNEEQVAGPQGRAKEKSELSSLLDKVKGLTRIGFRS